jgi:hypothetical protein
MTTTTRTIRITLTAYNMGSDATEADFDAWAAYVNAHIDEALGITTEIDQHPYRGGPADDTIRGASEIEEEEILTYLGTTGWEAFCAIPAAA